MLCQGTALLLPLITVHSETPDVFVHRVLISSPLQETKPKKRKFSPADENDSGIEVYYREEEDGDQEEEAAKKKSKVRSWKEYMNWEQLCIEMYQL